MRLEEKKDRFSRGRCAGAFALALALAGAGWGVRTAEFNQVGSDNNASTWTFAAAGLSAYYGCVGLVVRRLRKKKRN